MATRGTYKTKQRELVSSCLAAHADRYLTVDEVWAAARVDGSTVGRTTVYRTLEAMVAGGSALKAVNPHGEASYRLMPASAAGQLVCLSCGSAFALDCHMVSEFSDHVFTHHGFKVDPARTVLYGYCAACAEASR